MRRTQLADERGQFCARLPRQLFRLCDRTVRWILIIKQCACRPQLHGDRKDLLLDAIVQITGQAVALLDDRKFLQPLLRGLQFLYELLITISLPFYLLDGVAEETANDKGDCIKQDSIQPSQTVGDQE